MTMAEFNGLCSRYGIAPAIALENDEVVECLRGMKDASDDNAKNGYRNCLIQILETQF